MIILRVINEKGIKYDLDVLENADLKLNISAIESGDIGDVFGISSQAYALPGNENNNKFFGLLFDLGTTPATAFTKSVPCQVLYNGTEVFTGKLFIDNVVTNQRGDTLYNVTVVNEVVDFKYLIDDLTMQDLDWGYYDHNLTMANVTGSWDNLLFGGDVIYPLVDYGVNTNDQKSPVLKAGGKTKNFDNSSTPLREVDFRPAIRLKSVVDLIFDKVNYKYQSSFFNSSYFDNLYVLATQTESGNQFSSPVTASLWAQKGSTQTLNNNNPAYLDFSTEIYDNSNAWSTNTYTVPQNGEFTLYSQLTFGNITGTRPTSAEYLNLEWHVNGVAVASSQINITGTNGQTVYSGPFTLSGLAVGDTVKLLAYISTNPVYSASYPLVAGKITIDGPPTYKGGTVHLGQIFENNLPVLTFLKGIINKFNLVMEPVVGERNLITVEPFNDWSDAGATLDWTDKVDRSVRWEITHPVQQQPRNILLSDIADTDQLNKYTKDKFNKIYGQYSYVSDSDLASGEKIIGSFFAPTPIKGIDGSPQMLVPRLSQFSPGDVYSSPYNFKPRLLFNVGKVNAGIQLQGYSSTSGTTDYGKYWVRDDNGNPVKKSQYLLVHHLNLSVNGSGVLQDADFDSTKDLHFGNSINPGHWSYHQNQYNAKVKNSAFYEYWSFYLNELYDVDARKITLNILLKPAEIQSLKLNSKIFIDGHYYRIDNIAGANLTREDSVQVTLLKILNRKLYFPRRRVLSLDGVATDLTVDTNVYTVNGEVGYVDYETGQAVTGAIVEAVANKDGFTTYDKGTTVVWDTTPAVSYTQTSQNNFGNNLVEESATRISVTGDNNEIKPSAKEVTVVGDSNTVSEYVSTSQITGVSNQLKLGTQNTAIVNSNSNIISGSTDLVILGGGSNTVTDSSVVAIVNSPGSDILNSSTSRDVIVGGLNVTIDDSQTTLALNNNGETLSKLNGNTVMGNFQDTVTITGSDFRSGTNILAGTYIEEELYTNRNSHQIEAYSGSIEYAYSGTGLFKYIYEITFNSVPSGSGIGTIELPGIESQDQIGRTILFKCDNTISTSSSIYITSFGSTDPIEGSNRYILNQPYQTVTLRASQYPSEESLITEWRVIGTSTGTGGFGAGYGYGNFYSTASQANLVPGVSQSVKLDNTYEANGVSIASGSRIYFDRAGVYQFTYIAQVANAANSVEEANFWIKYNGVDYPNSNTFISLQPRKSATEPNYTLMSATFTGTAQNDNDYIEMYWDGTSTDLSLYYTGSNGEPATPSVIANVIPVGSLTTSGATPASTFPYTGSAIISGSLTVIGPNEALIVSGALTATSLITGESGFITPLGYVSDAGSTIAYFLGGELGMYGSGYSNKAALQWTGNGSVTFNLHNGGARFETDPGQSVLIGNETSTGGLLELEPWTTLPAAASHANTFAVSGSKPYFSDGSSWNALY